MRAAPLTIVRNRGGVGSRKKKAAGPDAIGFYLGDEKKPLRPDDLRAYLEARIEEAMSLPAGWVVLLDYVAARAPGGGIWFSAHERDAALYANVLIETRPDEVVTVKASGRYAQMLDEQLRWVEAVLG